MKRLFQKILLRPHSLNSKINVRLGNESKFLRAMISQDLCGTRNRGSAALPAGRLLEEEAASPPDAQMKVLGLISHPVSRLSGTPYGTEGLGRRHFQQSRQLLPGCKAEGFQGI